MIADTSNKTRVERSNRDQALALRLISGMLGLSGEPLCITGEFASARPPWSGMPAISTVMLQSERKKPVITDQNGKRREKKEALEPRLVGV